MTVDLELFNKCFLHILCHLKFAQAMFLVYCALEKEPVPMSLPPALVPPSKRKAVGIPGGGQVMPTSTSSRDSSQSVPPVGLLPSKAQVTQVCSAICQNLVFTAFMKHN